MLFACKPNLLSTVIAKGSAFREAAADMACGVRTQDQGQAHAQALRVARCLCTGGCQSLRALQEVGFAAWMKTVTPAVAGHGAFMPEVFLTNLMNKLHVTCANSHRFVSLRRLQCDHAHGDVTLLPYYIYLSEPDTCCRNVSRRPKSCSSKSQAAVSLQRL